MARKSAFTLIELLIVVAIIGILAAIAVPNFMNAQMRARISRTYADMKAIYSANEMYRLDYNTYSLDYDSGQVKGVGGVSGNEYLTYAKLTTPIAYMSSIPLDPFFGASTLRGFHPKAMPYFQYAGPFGEGRHSNQAVWDQYNMEYTVTSLGPDLEDQRAWSYPHETAPQVVYAISNGMKSKGDLYMSNKGLIQ